jgi:hypothetical protein
MNSEDIISRRRGKASMLQQSFELVDCQTGITDNCRHRVRIDRIVPGNYNSNWAFGHKDVFALAVDLKTSFLQRFDRSQMIYAGKFGH